MLTKNQIIELNIESIGSEGEGIGHYEDGMTVFVTDALPGDRVLAHIVKVKKNYAYAFAKEIVTPSGLRVESKCPVAKKCGGCTFLHLDYKEQLKFKQDKVLNAITRIGGIENPPMEEIVGAEHCFFYRNKAQFPVGTDKDGKPVIGFYRKRSHDVVANTECIIQADINAGIMATTEGFLREYNISAYNEETCKGLVRHIFTRTGFATGEVMVCVVINGKELPNWEILCDRLKSICKGACLELKSFCLNINKKNTNVIMGQECKALYGPLYIEDMIGDVRYRISPLSFFQVNPEQTKKLYDLALDYADLKGHETVWDLYCGIGTISLYLAKKAAKVYGVEIVPEAIENARENAQLNAISNAEFFVGASEDIAPKLPTPDVIVVDPPRKGCDDKLLETILSVKPERVVYVSCDPATLARDLKILCAQDYRLTKVRPVDQFCHTTHVETVVLLSKGVVDKDNFRKVKVDFSLEDMDLTELRGKATYAQVKEYILNEFGLKVSSLYIAQVKKKCGIETGENHNLPKSEDARQPQVTPEKEEAIMKAFKHYGII